MWKLELLQLLTRAVMPTSLHAKAYKERGYSLLQSVLSNEDITTMRSSIISYIEASHSSETRAAWSSTLSFPHTLRADAADRRADTHFPEPPQPADFSKSD